MIRNNSSHKISLYLTLVIIRYQNLLFRLEGSNTHVRNVDVNLLLKFYGIQNLDILELSHFIHTHE